MRAPPGSTVSDHGVEDGQQLPHTRHRSHRLEFAHLNEPLVECLDGGVVSAGDQRSHVEGFTHLRSATPDAAASPEDSKVPVDGSYSDQGREFSWRETTKLGKPKEEIPQREDPHHRGLK